MDKIKLYIKESYNEIMHHVTWPDWTTLLHTTKTVLIASLVISLAIMLMDAMAKGLMTTIYDIKL